MRLPTCLPCFVCSDLGSTRLGEKDCAKNDASEKWEFLLCRSAPWQKFSVVGPGEDQECGPQGSARVLFWTPRYTILTGGAINVRICAPFFASKTGKVSLFSCVSCRTNSNSSYHAAGSFLVGRGIFLHFSLGIARELGKRDFREYRFQKADARFLCVNCSMTRSNVQQARFFPYWKSGCPGKNRSFCWKRQYSRLQVLPSPASPRSGWAECFSPRARGPSPRAWGARWPGRSSRLRFRFIPTCVGSTIQRSRYCSATGGSSPRAWGALVHPLSVIRPARFIPTCVGSTMAPKPAVRPLLVHPHVRGEHTGCAGPFFFSLCSRSVLSRMFQFA